MIRRESALNHRKKERSSSRFLEKEYSLHWEFWKKRKKGKAEPEKKGQDERK